MPGFDFGEPHFGLEEGSMASEVHFDGRLRPVFTPNIRVNTNNVINSMLAVTSSPYLAITCFDSRLYIASRLVLM